MRLQEVMNFAIDRFAIKSHRTHISAALILNSDKEYIIILAHQHLLQVSNFALRFVCWIVAGVRPDWRPIRKHLLVHAHVIAQLHEFDYTSNAIQQLKE